VSRRLTTWIVALPLVLVGSQLAHAVAYRWAYPEADIRATILHQSGHGYLSYAPMLLAIAAAAELLALGATAIDAARRLPARELPPSLFALLPLVAYTLQEHLERLLSAAAFPWWTTLDPTFWRGALLQVPVGLVAWLVARLLVRTARAVGRSLGVETQRPLGHVVVQRLLSNAALLRIAPIASSAAGRAPPLGFVRQANP
jgi:hypothetical protein